MIEGFSGGWIKIYDTQIYSFLIISQKFQQSMLVSLFNLSIRNQMVKLKLKTSSSIKYVNKRYNPHLKVTIEKVKPHKMLLTHLFMVTGNTEYPIEKNVWGVMACQIGTSINYNIKNNVKSYMKGKKKRGIVTTLPLKPIIEKVCMTLTPLWKQCIKQIT